MNISFFHTRDQMYRGLKAQTSRRLQSWAGLQHGDYDTLEAIEKGQGIPAGGKVRKIGTIFVWKIEYKQIQKFDHMDIVREGFPWMSENEFQSMLMDIVSTKDKREWVKVIHFFPCYPLMYDPQWHNGDFLDYLDYFPWYNHVER